MLSNRSVGEGFWCKKSLDCKEIKSVNPNGNQPWIFTGKTDAKTETSIIWPLNAKSWLTGKEAGWCWERLKAKGVDGSRGWLDRITGSVDMNLSKLQKIAKDRGFWHTVVHEVTKSWKQLSNRTMILWAVMAVLWNVSGTTLTEGIWHICPNVKCRYNLKIDFTSRIQLAQVNRYVSSRIPFVCFFF